LTAFAAFGSQQWNQLLIFVLWLIGERLPFSDK